MKNQKTEDYQIKTRAEELILHYPFNEWIYFRSIPIVYHEGIIEIADNFIWRKRKFKFNEDYTAFKITSA